MTPLRWLTALAASAGLFAAFARAQSGAPVITSPLVVDTGWSLDRMSAPPYYVYRIQATNNPTSFGASGLPADGKFDGTSGEFALRPTGPAIYTIQVSATNAVGTGTATVQINLHEIAAGGEALNASRYYGLGETLRVGVNFPGPVVVAGSPRVYAGGWFDYEAGSGTTRLTFKHVVTLTDNSQVPLTEWRLDFNGGSIRDETYGLSVQDLVPGPGYDAWWVIFTANAVFVGPEIGSMSGTAGTPLSITPGQVNMIRFQATGLPPGLSIDPSSGSISGTPSTAGKFNVVLRGTAANGTSAELQFPWTINPGGTPAVAAGPAARLINLSARGYGNNGADALTAGVVVGGDPAKTKPLLFRGIGPSLAPYGVSNVVGKAALTLYRAGGQPVDANDGWGTDPLLSSTASSVGAFALSPNSGDSEIVWAVYPGAYTIQVTDDTSAGGNGMAEIYDANPADASTRLINLSAKSKVGGAASLIGGFVISGAGTETVLIRGIGPALAGFGVPAPLRAPTLTLYDSKNAVLAQNAGWPATAVVNGAPVSLASVFAQVGAFALPAGSADCALLVTLPAGAYTAQLLPDAGSTGEIGLIEIYEVSSE